jgi:hypothetical protein
MVSNAETLCFQDTELTRLHAHLLGYTRLCGKAQVLLTDAPQEKLMGEKVVAGISCTVGNCEHWTEGNRCMAGQILVTRSSPTLAASKCGTDTRRMRPTPAFDAEDTCCYTFKARE